MKYFWFDVVVLFLIGVSLVLFVMEMNLFLVVDLNMEWVYLIFDICFNICFIIEMCLKLFGFGVWRFYGLYFKLKFNIMDVVVVVISWLIVLFGDVLLI